MVDERLVATRSLVQPPDHILVGQLILNFSNPRISSWWGSYLLSPGFHLGGAVGGEKFEDAIRGFDY